MGLRFELRRPRSRILTSVIALLVLVGTIPLGLFGFRLTAYNRERLEVQQYEQQLGIAEATAREVAEFLRRERAAVGGLGQAFEAALAAGGGRLDLAQARDLGTLNRHLESDPDVLKLVYAIPSADGGDRRILEFVSAARAGDARVYAAAEELLVDTWLERGLQGLPTFAVPDTNPPVMAIVLPVRHREAVKGVLAALVSLQELQERLDARSQQLYEVYLTDAGGQRLLARSRRCAGAADLLTSRLVAAFRQGGGTLTMPFEMTREGERREMLGAFATVPDVGWGVMVQTDAASAFYYVLKMRETTLVWSAASVLLALGLGWLFARRLVHPIRELADGALRLARGDFSRRIELRSRNEIGLLAQSFNHMADEIQDQVEKLEAAARENKELFFAAIRMLADAIDEKDPYTRGHSERVTRFAVATARAYGMGEDEVERIEIGALLHDVGKIGIDDRILRKPTVLTDEEFEVMKQHPEKGAHILSAVRQLAEIVPGMRFHHEKVDGTGYPLGLQGDEIPLPAQIIGVADTFDAMTTDRPYQRGMDPEYVVAKLRGWVGIRFRADIVAAFEKAFRSGAIELRPKKAEAASLPAAGAP